MWRVDQVEETAGIGLLAEVYVARGEAGAATQAIGAVRRISDSDRSADGSALLMESLYLPDDELLLLLFRAPSEESIVAALRKAGLEVLRTSPCLRIAGARGRAIGG